MGVFWSDPDFEKNKNWAKPQFSLIEGSIRPDPDLAFLKGRIQTRFRDHIRIRSISARGRFRSISIRLHSTVKAGRSKKESGTPNRSDPGILINLYPALQHEKRALGLQSGRIRMLWSDLNPVNYNPAPRHWNHRLGLKSGRSQDLDRIISTRIRNTEKQGCWSVYVFEIWSDPVNKIWSDPDPFWTSEFKIHLKLYFSLPDQDPVFLEGRIRIRIRVAPAQIHNTKRQLKKGAFRLSD